MRLRVPPIVILTGPIHSGKTTRLAEWIEHVKATDAFVGGVLAPIVDGKRHLRSIRDGEQRLLELPGAATYATPAANEVRIGPYRFDGGVFAWACERLEADGARALRTRATDGGWIVIDEVGPLELRGEGLEPAVGGAVAAVLGGRWPGNVRLLLVVREALVDRVIDHYRLGGSGTVVVTKEELDRLA